jgi:hypothetical protein
MELYKQQTIFKLPSLEGLGVGLKKETANGRIWWLQQNPAFFISDPENSGLRETIKSLADLRRVCRNVAQIFNVKFS